MSHGAPATEVFLKLTTSVWHQRTVTYVIVASSTILAYDMVLNLNLEVKHIWRKKWSLVKVLYLLQRYLPFVDSVGLFLYHQFKEALSPQDCFSSFHFGGWCHIVGIMLSEVLLAIRLWAVWERKISATIIILVFFLGCWIPSFVFFSSFIDATKFAASPLPQFRGCFVSGGNDMVYLCWVLLMVYNTGALIMIVIPGFSAYRIGGKSKLVKAVYRDGVIYYILIFLVSLINIVVILTLPRDLVNILSPFERVLHSVLTSRAVLHIRRVASTEPTVSTIPTMEFAATANDTRIGCTST
ncbi:hypothetical protein PM082_004332 [Marasmius tenuissimus]|nr:hypothetical protein PM082_004332 [Marasmius tenuissimus]